MGTPVPLAASPLYKNPMSLFDHNLLLTRLSSGARKPPESGQAKYSVRIVTTTATTASAISGLDEQASLIAERGPDLALKCPGRFRRAGDRQIGIAAFPVFSVFSHFISAFRNSLM